MLTHRITAWGFVAGMTVLGASLALAQEGANAAPKEQTEQRDVLGGPRVKSEQPARPTERRESMGEPLREVLPQLDLTPEQREKIKAIMDQARTEREKFRDENHEQLEKLHKELRAAGEAKDEQKAREILKQIRAIQEKGPRPMDQLNKIKEVLTPEQREKLELKLRELEKKMREQREQMGPGPGPGGPRPEREGGPDARPNPAP